MTLAEFKAALLAIDPALEKYKSTKTGNYTIWSPGNLAPGLDSDDDKEENDQRIYVDRFSLSDNDTIAKQITAMLRSNFVPFEYVHIYENDTGYLHHSWTCVLEE